eukprot:TRINITY_DN5226_c1_g3_i1.p1 TRINITY_DN5226_c1_g3~~TRINITY_DN5226_c1_g3_i1.p1  ORF type:complete len:172 (-),score=22.60 TRINITY_DN5226_c1_g3_i1:403-918(-)
MRPRFDSKVLNLLGHILNADANSFSVTQLRMIQLPIRLGGTGLRSAVTLSPLCYLASTLCFLPKDMLAECQEVNDCWNHCKHIRSAINDRCDHLKKTRLFKSDVVTEFDGYNDRILNMKLQKAFSSFREEYLFNRLCEDEWSRARLLSLQGKYAGSWLKAYPGSKLFRCRI